MDNQTLSLVTVNANVGMDEVVDVLMSQYEDGLYEKKKELQDLIKVVAQSIKDLKTPICDINVSDYVMSHTLLGIQSEVTSIKVVFGDKPMINVSVTISNIGEKGYKSTIEKTINLPVKVTDVKSYTKLDENMKSLTNDLSRIMTDISDISHKERQIRDIISSKKLEQSGMMDLLKSNDILSLIKIE